MRISDWSSDVCSSDLPNPRTEPGHTVAVKPGTLLAQIAGTAELAVNSAHHQAAKDEPAGVVVSGRAPDGVLEAIESPAHHFRSDERRVGKECVSTCKYRWSPYH